ncbi:centriolar and ciliogenesis-associated protein HYLS1 isoform X2 [Dendropsophus ebraccatus]
MSVSDSLSSISAGNLSSFSLRPQRRPSHDDSDHSLRTVPLTVSLEELRSELSLLGFTSVPQQRLLQFKQDLESLMQSPAALEVSSGSSGDRTDPREEAGGAAGAWDPLPVWPSPSPSQEPSLQDTAHSDPLDSYIRHTVKVGPQGLQKPRPPIVTRKVLRRKSDGQLQVCNESLLSTESEPEDSRASRGDSQAVKSFIRVPPYSLLEQYRQRSDPVGRYQEYKQSWDVLQVSLEKSKKELRWEVRERMMSAPPLPVPRALPTPNSYVIPTEKKRYGLRWAIRQDLVHGNIPGGASS